MKICIGHTDLVNYVAWDPGGKYIVTASSDSTVRIWEAASGLELAILIPGRSSSIAPAPIGNATWEPNGKRIATASDDGTPRVWDAESGKELFTFWSPDGKRILIASFIWERAFGNCTEP
jgi:WD40 repeat protein